MRPARARRLIASSALIAMCSLTAAITTGCSSDETHPAPPWATTTLGRPSNTSTPILSDAAFPAALAVTPDGGVIYGERSTGRIIRLAADLTPPGIVVATVVVSEIGDSQRGLLGLAVDPDDGTRVFASWTRSGDSRIVVAQVTPGPQRIIWEGPPSAEVANAGRLVWRGAALVLSIGDLNRGQPAAGSPPGAATDWRGTIISLDPDGPADQTPTVLSSGWNNPYALALGPEGDLWLADNIGGGCCERLAHLPATGEPVITRLGDDQHEIVPAAIVPLGPERFGVCSYLTHQMLDIQVIDGRLSAPSAPVFDGCSIAAVRLDDHRVVMATESTLSIGVL